MERKRRSVGSCSANDSARSWRSIDGSDIDDSHSPTQQLRAPLSRHSRCYSECLRGCIDRARAPSQCRSAPGGDGGEDYHHQPRPGKPHAHGLRPKPPPPQPPQPPKPPWPLTATDRHTYMQATNQQRYGVTDGEATVRACVTDCVSNSGYSFRKSSVFAFGCARSQAAALRTSFTDSNSDSGQ